MAPNARPKTETLYLRRDYTDAERLTMGDDLAQAHNRMAAIEEEEAVMKAQIKDRKAGVEQTIGSLSRKLRDRYEMENVVCTLHWDVPNVNEVTYRRPNGEFAKVRAMVAPEMQKQLPFEEKDAEAKAEASAANIGDFFDKPIQTVEVAGPEPTLPLDDVPVPPALEAATGEREVHSAPRGHGSSKTKH